MSYESRVFVVNRVSCGNDPESVFGFIGADFQLGKMKHFPDIFKTEIDFDLIGDKDIELTTDSYGERCKSCDIATAIDYLSDNINSDLFYKGHFRAKSFLSYLKAFQESIVSENMGDKWLLVHYGY